VTGGDNDLVPVWIHVNPTEDHLDGENIDIFLKRSSSVIRVWGDYEKSTPLLVSQTEVNLDISGSSGWAYVEWDPGDTTTAEAFLELYAKDNTTGVTKPLDTVRFYPFNSIVIAFVGEFQSPADPDSGMHETATGLHESGYDVQLFDEGDVGWDGLPYESYWAAYNAAQYAGVDQVALIGYSHGGGAVYTLAERLQNDPPPGMTLAFTAYIDAIRNGSTIAETRLPLPGNQYHHNQYQNTQDPDWWNFSNDGVSGEAVPGAGYNDNVQEGSDGNLQIDEVTHSGEHGIAQQGAVQAALSASLQAHMPTQ
jgi:hypothetical protein